MRTNIPLSILALEVCAASAAQVVPLSFTKTRRHVSTEAKLARRASTFSANLDNSEFSYSIDVQVGSPPQKLSLQLDTGSADVWMPSSSVDCANTQDECKGGTFKQSASSSFTVVDRGGFNISYVDGTGSTGDYFTDNFYVGNVEVKALQMGLATQTSIGSGIMGIAFDNDEAVCTSIPCDSYPSVMDQLVKQGLINTKSYSLWLDDLNAKTGTILFGGVDTAKYKGDLTELPVQVDSYAGVITSFSVAWTNFTVTTSKAVHQFVPAGFATAAILDSGTSVTTLPDDIAQQLADQLGAEYNNEVESYVGECSVGKSQGSFDFQFGGSNGPIIHVPLSEMYEPLLDPEGNPQTFQNGAQACLLGFSGAGDNPILFGDTFLRSAYVVYDLDNKKIGLAATNFNPSGSNIVEIGANGIPGISATATAISVTQTATLGGGYGETNIGSDLPTGATSIQFGVSTTGGILGELTPASGSGNPATSPTKTNSAVSTIPAPDYAGIMSVGVALIMAAVGGSLILF